MGISLQYKSCKSNEGEQMIHSNLIINEIPKKYKLGACLENTHNILLWNFLIKKIQKIKINAFPETSKNPSLIIFLLINLIIKLINKFFRTHSIIHFPNPGGVL
mgnify:CR=1 FL=1